MFFYEFPLLDTNIRTLIAARAPLPNSGWYSSLTPFVTSETGRNLERLSSRNRSWDRYWGPRFSSFILLPVNSSTSHCDMATSKSGELWLWGLGYRLVLDSISGFLRRGFFLELKAFLFLALWKPSALHVQRKEMHSRAAEIAGIFF